MIISYFDNFFFITKNIQGLLRISTWVILTSIIILVGSIIAYDLNELFLLYSLITLKIEIFKFIPYELNWEDNIVNKVLKEKSFSCKDILYEAGYIQKFNLREWPVFKILWGLIDINLNELPVQNPLLSDSFKFNIKKGLNIVDFFSKFQFLDVIMNSSKYSNIPSYFQDYTVVSDFNKYSSMKALKFLVGVLPENIPLPSQDIIEIIFLTLSEYVPLLLPEYVPLPCPIKGETMLLMEPFQIPLPSQTEEENFILTEPSYFVPLPLQTEEEVIFLMEPDSKGYITVLTTVPCIDGNLKEVITTNRLIIRIPNISDLEGYHLLYKQSEAMGLYIMGHGGSKSINETKSSLISYSGIKYVAFLKNLDGKEGELIGEVSLIVNGGYGASSSISYVFKKEYWGQGYGTESAKAFVEYWWTLPRKDIITRILPSNLNPLNGGRITEQLSAWTLMDNNKSQNLLSKLGFIKHSRSESKTILAWANGIYFFLVRDMYDWVLYKDSFTN